MRYAPRVGRVGLCTLLALAACSDTKDAPLAPTPPPTSPSRGPTNGLRDEGIDRRDTYFSAVMTTTVETGASLVAGGNAGGATLVAPGSRQTIEGGYGSDGRIRFTVWLDDLVQSPTVGSVRLVGDQLTLYDRRSVAITSQQFDDFMAAVGFPGGNTLFAYFPGLPGGLGGCHPGNLSCAPAEALRAEGSPSVTATGEMREVRVTMPSTGSSSAAGHPVSVVQRYRVLRSPEGQDSTWRLEEIRRAVPAHPSHPSAGIAYEVTRLQYGAWHRNPTRDAARAAAMPSHEIARPAPRRDGGTNPVPIMGPATPDPAFIDGVCASAASGMARLRTQSPTTVNVLYQHGFCGDAGQWVGFDNRLALSNTTGLSRAYSLRSTDRVEAQVTELRERLRSDEFGLRGSATQYVVVGHSQGGLVARRLGQRFPELVRGVVTIGTPHLGAQIAAVGPEAAAEVLEQVVRRECFLLVVCDLFEGIIREQTRGLLTFGLDAAAPALQDLRPNSPFLNTLNTTSEAFPRVSVEVAPDKRWILARMIGDIRTPTSVIERGHAPYGEQMVRTVATTYAAAHFVRAMSALMIWQIHYNDRASTLCGRYGYSTTWPSCNGQATGSGWFQPWFQTTLLYILFDVSGRVIGIMDHLDRTWDELTTQRRDDSDGLIQRRSQRYPTVPGRVEPLRISLERELGVSHAGQTKGPTVVQSMYDAFEYINRNWRP